MLKMQKDALAIDLSRSTLARSVSEYSLEQAFVEGIKSLRAGWCEDGDKRWVMIGFPEEWATV